MILIMLILLALLVPQSLALVSECPEVKVVDNFNISAFGSGVWYQMARYPNVFEVLTKCVSIEYSCKDDEVYAKIQNVPLKSLSFASARARYADEKRNGNLTFNFEYGWPINTLEWPMQVLAIDYDRYGIYYSCHKDKITGIPHEHAWIFSRTNKLEDSLKKEIDDYLKSSMVIDTSKLIWIDHSRTICKIGSFLESLGDSLKKL